MRDGVLLRRVELRHRPRRVEPVRQEERVVAESVRPAAGAGDAATAGALDRAGDAALRALEGREGPARDGAYVAVLAVAAPDGTILTSVEGRCRGRIGHVRLGQHGFGYDPLFIPEAELEQLRAREAPGRPRPPRTMAELEPAEKDALSHRGAAFRALRPFLAQLAFDNSGR